MNFTLLYYLALTYMPYFYFDTNEIQRPIEMSHILDDSSVYYKHQPIKNNINTYDKLIALQMLDNNQFVYSSIKKTNKQTHYKIHNNEYYYNFANSSNPIYLEFIADEQSTYIVYSTLYMYNGAIMCGLIIPCGYHDGDLEHVILDINHIDYKPSRIFYSSHHDGYWFPWNIVEKENTHPVVYVSKNAHANYPIKGIYMRYFGFISEQSDGMVKWEPKKTVVLHKNFTSRSKEYLYNGYIGDIPSFCIKREKYLTQIKESKLYSFKEMIIDMFYAVSEISEIFGDVYFI